jgi:hypothetical protein
MADEEAPNTGHEQGEFPALLAAYKQAVAEIEAMSDGAAGFSRATELRDLLDRLVGQAAELRARMVGKVWESEEMTLSVLASRIGVSKQRASVWVKAAKAAENKEQ